MNRLLLLPLLALPLLLARCSFDKDNPVGSVEKTRSVTIAIATTEGFDTIASGAEVRVSAPDIKEIRCKLTIKSSSITGTITHIPVGSNRLFEVLVYDKEGQIIYTGSSYADIDPLKVADVVITLKKFEGGTAVVHGSLTDPDAPCTFIQFTTLGSAGTDYHYEEKIVKGRFMATAMSSHAKSYNHDTLEFYWELSGETVNTTTAWAPADNDGIVSFMPFSCPFDDQVRAIVHVRCSKHPEVTGVDTVTCVTGYGFANFYSNNIYPYTYVDTVDFDMGPQETRTIHFKEGEDVCLRITGGWCTEEGACWDFPIKEKGGPAAGPRYMYPELPAATCLADWTGSPYSPIVFNGSDCWTFDKDQDLVLFANRLIPDERGTETGSIHVHYTVRGGVAMLPWE